MTPTQPASLLVVEPCIGGFVACYVPDADGAYPEVLECFSPCPLTAAADALSAALQVGGGGGKQ